jgi:hypothetical protein
MYDSLERKEAPWALSPYASSCYNFTRNGALSKKTAWLVPHVIKHREDSTIISWRCSWGPVCEAGCIYAMAKEPVEPALTGSMESRGN